MEDDLHRPQHVNCTEDSKVVLEAECFVAAPEVVDGCRDLSSNEFFQCIPLPENSYFRHNW